MTPDRYRYPSPRRFNLAERERMTRIAEGARYPAVPRPARLVCATCRYPGRERGHCECWTPLPNVKPRGAYEPWSMRLRGKERTE